MVEHGPRTAEQLAAARAGSRDALGRLLDRCRAYLLLIAEKELEPDLRAKGGASDLVQETFLEAQKDFARFHGDSEEELRAWLRQILLNNMANFSRRFRDTAKRRLTLEFSLEGDRSSIDQAGGMPDAVAPPEVTLIEREQAEQVERALERLPDDYRQILVMRYREGHSFEEIGRLTGRTGNAARKVWLRAVERLQQELGAP